MSYHPADEGVVRLPPAPNSRFSRVLHCAQHLSQGPVALSMVPHGRVTFHWRTLHQSSLLATRLHFTEDEGQRYLLIRTKKHLD